MIKSIEDLNRIKEKYKVKIQNRVINEKLPKNLQNESEETHEK